MTLEPTALDLSADETAVLAALARHRGRAQAINKEALAFEVGLSERMVRRAIVHLIKRHGQPIGCTSHQPGGYFLIETAEEQREAEDELAHRITSLAIRLARLKKNTPAQILDQLRLALDEGVPTDARE